MNRGATIDDLIDYICEENRLLKERLGGQRIRPARPRLNDATLTSVDSTRAEGCLSAPS
jgi:hypothetical protein